VELDRIAAVLRPRSPWESVDHGFFLVRAWWKAVYGTWIPLLFTTWAIVLLPLHRYPGWALLIVWWLRPVLERVPLFVLSRALFSATPSFGEVVKALPKLLRGHLIPALVIFRATPARSFHLPVWELEGLRGRDRWRRSSVLARDVLSQAVLLTVGMSLLDLFVILGGAGLGSFLFPERDVGFLDIGPLFSGAPIATNDLVLLLVLMFLSQGLLGPLYVAGGFALYIDRRTIVEGWDVEITFRSLARRLTATGTMAASLLLACVVACGQLAADTVPQSTPGQPQGTGAPEASIERVLSHPDFATKRTVTHWVPKNRKDQKAPDDDFVGAVEGVSALWSVLRPVFAFVVLVFLAVLLWRFARRAWEERSPQDVRLGEKRQTLKRGELARTEELPADIPAASLSAWQAGRHEEALSLLYRAVLARLVAEGLPLSAASTEADCLAASRRSGPAHREDYVRRLVRAWQGLAYAHVDLPEAEGQGLCVEFGPAFRPKKEPE
jgi:hypothetical protein